MCSIKKTRIQETIHFACHPLGTFLIHIAQFSHIVYMYFDGMCKRKYYRIYCIKNSGLNIIKIHLTENADGRMNATMIMRVNNAGIELGMSHSLFKSPFFYECIL